MFWVVFTRSRHLIPSWEGRRGGLAIDANNSYLLLVIFYSFKILDERQTSCLGSLRVPQTPWAGRTAALQPNGRD